MIEIPCGAPTAGEIALVAEFFSFGTNDLTQMTYGYSRDDAERNFLLKYVEDEHPAKESFQIIDQEGVGRLMDMSVKEGRATCVNLEIGIVVSMAVTFIHRLRHIIGNNYVSLTPFRVPIARLAAAHSALKHKGVSIAADL